MLFDVHYYNDLDRFYNGQQQACWHQQPYNKPNSWIYRQQHRARQILELGLGETGILVFPQLCHLPLVFCSSSQVTQIYCLLF